MAPGNGFMTEFEVIFGKRSDENANRAPESSIRRRSRRPKKGAPRLRRGEEDRRPQEAHPRRYARVDPGGSRTRRQRSRSGRGEAGPRRLESGLPSSSLDLGRRGLRWSPRGLDLRAAEVRSYRSGDCSSIGAGSGLRASGQEMGSRADVRLAWTLSAAQQGLRAPSGVERVDDLCVNDQPHDSAAGTCLNLLNTL